MLSTEEKYIEQQRKHITILFCDIVSSREISENFDPEETEERFDRNLLRLAEPITQSGGHVARFMGDGFMGVFGVPIAHENDAESAARAGLDILEVSQRLAKEIEDQFGSLRNMIYTQLNLGLAYYRLGDQIAALDVLLQANCCIMEIENPFAQAFYHAYSGLVAEQVEQIEEAREHYEKAADLFKQIGAQGFTRDALAGLARVEQTIHNITTARQYAFEVWDYLSRNGSEGMEFPILAYLTCARIFQTTRMSKEMNRVIQEGYDELIKRADKFSDHSWRRTYLQALPENIAMLEMWKSLTYITKGDNDGVQ